MQSKVVLSADQKYALHFRQRGIASDTSMFAWVNVVGESGTATVRVLDVAPTVGGDVPVPGVFAAPVQNNEGSGSTVEIQAGPSGFRGEVQVEYTLRLK